MIVTLARHATTLGLALALALGGDEVGSDSSYRRDPFRQLEELLPTPTSTRAASGAPGARYWQQRADYAIKVELDERQHRIRGSERITYTNNSPDELSYLWLQLDANIYRPDSDAARTRTAPAMNKMSFEELEQLLARERFDGGVRVQRVAARGGERLRYTVVKTMMRVELPRPLKPGKRFVLDIDWSYAINNSALVGGRTGYERFEADGNDIFEIAQWFPRMVAYSDATGWQHKQFLGRGEFTLELGDYDVEITAPADHVVTATGVLQNPRQVLTAKQRARLDRARRSKRPVFVVTPEEARAAETAKAGATRTKTWRFKAEDVRDFAFASSRKFIWDAMAVRVKGRKQPVMAMSLYPNEAEPLWSHYSTRAVAHTLDVYSRHTFPYPYPVAISVNGPVGGMEYPMICFNGPRPEDDGTYTERTKYGLISVVIHEVGHNYFPMIVNSDERQWTWMDEGLNSFLQFLAEQAWEADYPSRRGEPADIVGYMTSARQVPIMTNSESLLQFGNNAYGKPATALNILRETVLGRELFDYAFRVYARRWRFRRPMPADFFRTMEDASGVDLDWFWRGWFYTTLHADIALESVREFTVDSREPEVEKAFKRQQDATARPKSLTELRNKGARTLVDELPELKDFYNDYDEYTVSEGDRAEYRELLDAISDEERRLLKTNKRFYVVELKNRGGLVMPVILELRFEDGSREELRIPAEIWRRDSKRARTLIVRQKPLRGITLDPHLETADADLDNNHWPPTLRRSRFQLFKRKQNSHRKSDPRYERYEEFEQRKRARERKNPMQKARRPSD